METCMNMKKIVPFLVVMLLLGGSGNAAESGELLQQGRKLFYTGVEQEADVRKAIDIFREIVESDSAMKGKALTYIGASTALLGKHARWPQKKFEYVTEGIRLMERGIARSPEDLESLFIYASTCHYLPFFFRKGDDARAAFERIVDLSLRNHDAYPDSLMRNAMEFIETNGNPGDDELERIYQVKARLN